MTRVLLVYVLPFLLPLALYIGWVWLSRRKNTEDGPWQLAEGPWLWFVAAGIALMAGGMVYLGLSGGSEPGGTYQPPRYEDGAIIPGRVIPESDKNRRQ